MFDTTRSAAFLPLLLIATGCLKPALPPQYHPMGERAQMGIFSVIASETVWSNGFGEGPAAHTPTHRFLAVNDPANIGKAQDLFAAQWQRQEQQIANALSDKTERHQKCIDRIK